MGPVLLVKLVFLVVVLALVVWSWIYVKSQRLSDNELERQRTIFVARSFTETQGPGKLFLIVSRSTEAGDALNLIEPVLWMTKHDLMLTEELS